MNIPQIGGFLTQIKAPPDIHENVSTIILRLMQMPLYFKQKKCFIMFSFEIFYRMKYEDNFPAIIEIVGK